jgi:outer membrane usher protein
MMALAFALGVAATATNAQDEIAIFDPNMLVQGIGGVTIDTRRFQRVNYAEAGTHHLDVYFNGQWRGVEDIEFRHIEGFDSAVPCYDTAFLDRGGLDLNKVSRAEGVDPLPDALTCEELAAYVPGGQIKLDIAQQRLYITYPEYLQRLAASHRYVDPSQWDSGMTAARLNYTANVYTSEGAGRRMTRGYSGLNLGVNVGALRFRHTGSVTWSTRNGARYQASSYYVQTDLPSWQSQLLLGESATSGELFDSVTFRGVQLASDDRMLPETLRYYTPIVRGTANSNAKVSVYQRGFLVYETTVSPGPFAIEDVRANSYGGDLDVRVTEADGSSRSFVVPFATIVQLLRPGTTQYSLTAGRAADPGLRGSSQYVLQGTLKRGVGDAVTAYGGLAFTDDYRSMLLGAAMSTRIGAFAADVTTARADLPGAGKRSGASYRLTYSKDLPNSGTSFSLLAYRYSTSGYVGLGQAVAAGRASYGDGYRPFRVNGMRSRFDANINQALGERWGSVYVAGSAANYWSERGNALNFALGYSNSWNRISYSLGVQRVHSVGGADGYRRGNGDRSTQVTLNISIPLGSAASGGSPRLNTFYSRDSQSGTRLTTGATGALDEESAGTYSVSASHTGGNGSNTADASLAYQFPQVSVSASVGAGQGYRQASMSANGGVLVHGGGVTFAQAMGETVALVEAKGAQGARVGYGFNQVDARGYAIVGHLTPYRLNSVDLDPKNIPDDIELKTSSVNIAPRAGAIAKLVYPTLRARQLLIRSTQADGASLPFGAEVIDVATALPVGVVGQGSRIVMRAEQDSGTVRVQWGTGDDEQCLIDYQLPERNTSTGYDVLELACTAGVATPVLKAAAGDALTMR